MFGLSLVKQSSVLADIDLHLKLRVHGCYAAVRNSVNNIVLSALTVLALLVVHDSQKAKGWRPL